MKESDRLLFRENHTKFSRALMILRMYWPALRLKFAILSILALLITISIGFYAKVTGNTDHFGGFYLISIMVMLAPVTIARRDYRDISSQLPVTAGEKFSVLVFLYWFLFPACITLAQMIGEVCVKWLFGITLDPKFYYEYLGNEWVFYLCGAVQTLSVITVILYTLVKARNNRILSGIGAGVLTYVCYMAVSMFLSVIVGVIAGYRAVGIAEGAEDVIVGTVKGYFPLIMAMLFCIAVAVLTVFSVKLYKRLNNSGF